MAGESDKASGGLIQFNCVNCGSPIPVLAPGQSLTFVCPACHSIVQDDNEGKKILIETQAGREKPQLTLGQKAEFRGNNWQIIGYMIRSNIEENYYWSEYLLFNPYEGYRFLMEANGHWNFIALTKTQPTDDGHRLKWNGVYYSRFYTGQSKVQTVLGEFYWRVRIGDIASVEDYVAAPDLLSVERTGSESIWSYGVYVPHTDIAKAFKSERVIREPIGVAPNQPSVVRADRGKILKAWGAAVLAFCLIQTIILFVVPPQTVLTETVTAVRTPGGGPVLNTQSFEIPDDGGNLQVSLHSSLSNAWLSVIGTLIPEEKGESFAFQKELSFYSWADDEGSGVDDDSRAQLFFPGLKAGRYHFALDVDQDAARRLGETDTIDIRVQRNVPVLAPFWIAILLVSLYPLYRLLGEYRFESRRWSESNVRDS